MAGGANYLVPGRLVLGLWLLLVTGIALLGDWREDPAVGAGTREDRGCPVVHRLPMKEGRAVLRGCRHGNNTGPLLGEPCRDAACHPG